jgi:Guanylate-binding protein, N-terminal domain/Guanylate-binding protein, C-terminal domain/PX domain
MESEGAAIPLILYYEREGFRITPEGLEFLNSIDKKIGVISVAGKYRTGKSYLLNKIILNIKSQGFGVGPTINPCTKGIWIYNKPIDIKTSDGDDIALLILDSEGLGAFDEDANHDTRIFMLAVLLSSYFIYNSVGSIDENALNNFSLIINLTKNLQIRATDSELDVEELSNYFPSLLWVLRDFSLQLIDPSGNTITTKEYLENSLQPQKGTSDAVEAKNRIRKLLKHFFRDRDCFSLVRPSEDERTLQNLQNIDSSALRPEFVNQSSQLNKIIYKRVKVKTLNGKPITGKMLAGIAMSYVDAINKGAVPTIEGAWQSVCNAECNKQIDLITGQYDQKLKSSLTAELLSQEKLKKIHKSLKTSAEKDFREKAVGDDLSQFLEVLKKRINERFEFVNKQNERKILEKCEEQCQALCQEMQDKLRGGEYTDFQNFRREFDKKCLELKKKIPAGESAELKLKEISATLLTEAAEYISRNAMLEQQSSNRKLTQQLEFVKSALETKKEEFLKEKEYYKGRLKELEAENYQIKASLAAYEMKLEETKQEKERINTHHLQRMNTLKDDFKDRFTEYKEKYEDTNRLYTELQQKYNNEINTLQKDIALAKQETEWKSREAADSKARKEEIENEFREIRSQLRVARQELEAKEELIKELKSAPKLPTEPSPDWIMEKNFLKSQLESLKFQLEDNKSVQEALVTALQSRTLDSSRSESKDPAKHLSIALEKTEERCRQLEQKIEKLKKYQKIFKSCSSAQCNYCGKNFTSNIFFNHINNCEQSFEQTIEAGQYSIIVNQIVVRDDAPDQKPYTEYVISIDYKGRKWNISRRYKNFAILHSNLQKEFPNIELPDSTNLFSTQAGSMFSSKPVMRLEDRRKANQDYLSGLAAIPCIKNSAVFKKFIGSDQHFPEEMIEKPSMAKSFEKTSFSRKKSLSDED